MVESDINVRFCDGTLTITADKLKETEEKKPDYSSPSAAWLAQTVVTLCGCRDYPG